MREFYVLANRPSDPVHQLLDSNALFIRYQVGLASSLIALNRLLHRIGQMFDIARVVMSRSLPNHQKSSSGRSLVEHDKSLGITRAKNSRGTHYRDPHPLPKKFLTNLFAFPFSFLIPI